METVVVVGVGYIGLPLAASLANVGYRVIGLDIDQKKVDHLNATYEPDIYEPGVKETLLKNKKNISFTTSYQEAISPADTLFITVGTPVTDANEPDFRYIKSAAENIGKHLKKGQLLILKSTVVIGTTQNYFKDILEKISGLKAGEDFYLAFCPERTIEGLALHELYNLPKIVGGINKESSERCKKVVERLGSKVFIVSSPEVAEVCKLIDNIYRSINIGFANEVGMLCEHLGINAHEVVNTVNASYNRTNIFTPGLGADGPCLSKDPIIFKYSAQKIGSPYIMADACIDINLFSTYRFMDMIQQFLEKNAVSNPKIALIGLAFKGFPETDDIRGSPALKLFEKLKNITIKNVKHISFSFYDPIITSFNGTTSSNSLEDAVENADIILFLTNHRALMNVDFISLLKKINIDNKKKILIIDCWGNISNYSSAYSDKRVEYFRIGDGTKHE